MRPTLSLREHADLVDRMARHLGLDLEEAVMRGHLAPDALPDLVLGCKNCAHPEACAHLLDAAEAGPRPQAPSDPVLQALPSHDAPWYCRNADVFDALRWV